MAKTVIDCLEMIKIEQKHRHRFGSFSLMRAELERVIHKSTTAQQPGEMISARSGAVDVHVMILDHQHHDECGANRVEDCFESEYRQPSRIMPRRQERSHGERHHENPGVQAWHHNSGGARITRSASFPPKFDRDEKRVDRHNQSAEDRPVTFIQRPGYLTDSQPQPGADECREWQYVPALEQAYPVPDHAARKKRQSARYYWGQLDDWGRHRSQRHRRGADQISRAPPRERANIALLHPIDDQEQPE